MIEDLYRGQYNFNEVYFVGEIMACYVDKQSYADHLVSFLELIRTKRSPKFTVLCDRLTCQLQTLNRKENK